MQNRIARPEATEQLTSITVAFLPNDRQSPVGKLADAELYFEGGIFDGLKLIGFALWERRGGNGMNVTFPARQYSVNGERRSFALLRPVMDATAQDRIRDLIVTSWEEFKTRQEQEPKACDF